MKCALPLHMDDTFDLSPGRLQALTPKQQSRGYRRRFTGDAHRHGAEHQCRRESRLNNCSQRGTRRDASLLWEAPF